jgi:hypothetical protein
VSGSENLAGEERLGSGKAIFSGVLELGCLAQPDMSIFA